MYCCRYRYDPLDRLISHIESAAPRHRFYCKNRLVTEIEGALRHSIVQHGDLLLAQNQHENDAFGTTLLATDLQRSVLLTLEKSTGRQPIAYSPYGHRCAESRLTGLLRFNGERPDPVTGHYLLGNGYRAFNPVLMRFNSPDSLSPFGKGGINSYMYCLGDPINRGDPDGKSPLVFLKGNLTGKMKVSGETAYIQPGISTNQAMRAKSKIELQMKQIDKNTANLNAKFKSNMERNYSPTTSDNTLQELAINTINSNNKINITELPNKLKDHIQNMDVTTRHFYEEVRILDKIDLSRLDWVALRGSHIHLHRDHMRLRQLALAYQREVSAIRDTNEALEINSRGIFNDHFTSRR
ncbi:RHS repeat-associated core domain-containing protein [Pseudomonas sp. MAG733B]|uniref:RHS repeat-associated core domain-containing protein n=1 Tax=Pseudomonas sp. MAG733B TaxID=3122079 RepID=UPI0030CABD57